MGSSNVRGKTAAAGARAVEPRGAYAQSHTCAYVRMRMPVGVRVHVRMLAGAGADAGTRACPRSLLSAACGIDSVYNDIQFSHWVVWSSTIQLAIGILLIALYTKYLGFANEQHIKT